MYDRHEVSVKVALYSSDGGEERPVWLMRTEVEATDKLAPGYRDFLLKWWPRGYRL